MSRTPALFVAHGMPTLRCSQALALLAGLQLCGLMACRSAGEPLAVHEQDHLDARYRELADSILALCPTPPEVSVTVGAPIGDAESIPHLSGEWGNGVRTPFPHQIQSRVWWDGDSLTVLLSTYGRWLGPHIALKFRLVNGEPTELLAGGAGRIHQHSRFEDAPEVHFASGSIEWCSATTDQSRVGARWLRLDLLRADGTSGRLFDSTRGVVCIPGGPVAR